MKVKDRMTRNVKTVELDTNINEAFRLMKENNIRRLPVLNKGQLVGIITLSDLNQAAPSSATSLSIHELNYLLAKTKIKDILPKKQKVVTVKPDNYIETAAKIMRQYTVSGLPVVENGQVVGLVTETDIFGALIDILGVQKPHSRIDVYAIDRPGNLAEIISIIAKHGINILNTVVYYDEKKDKYKIILRIEALECEKIAKEIETSGYEIESIIVREHGEEI
ncbi:MAG: CBS and ACT domain-containing protein [Syntrophomonadaceae bacterium]|nr:CBS and ACT domain-containing protein [Syntrophomonadaceae bacterium]